MTMTHKQRIIAAARKQPVDKLPFGARIDLWYNYHSHNNTLPEKYEGLNIIDILRDLGAGCEVVLGGQEVSAGTGRRTKTGIMWDEEYSNNVEVVIQKEDPITTTLYKTPKGTVSTKLEYNRTEGYISGYVIEHLFKSAKDYPVIEYLIENESLIPDYEGYSKLAEQMGEDGVIMCGLRCGPMQYIMRDMMGYEAFFYELADNPDKVDHLYEVVKEQWQRQLEISADSPATIVQICGNWSDEIHTPVFRKYFIPWLNEATNLLHGRGKLAQVHIDGEMKRLIPLALETGIDIGEAWSPAPMTSVTTKELREMWGDRITIWGGLPTVIFEPSFNDDAFEAYVINLFKEIAPGSSFILGMGDNFPIDGNIERVRQVVKLIDKYGTFYTKD